MVVITDTIAFMVAALDILITDMDTVWVMADITPQL